MTAKKNATMAIHMDAGPDREQRPRRIFAILDAGANVVDVLEQGKKDAAKVLADAGYQGLPTFGPLDVKTGTYREMLRQKRQGNPEIRQRRNGRVHKRHNTPLGATIGERASNLKRHLTRRGAR